MHWTARLARSALAALLAAFALAAPTAVAAATIPAAYVQAARAAWPGSPCAGREIIRLVPTIPDAIGYAYPDACTVEILERIAPTRLGCYLLVHEFGHLAGHDHTDASSIMGPIITDTHAYITGSYEPCERAVRMRAWRDVLHTARGYAPDTGVTEMACRWVTPPIEASCRVAWVDVISEVAFRARLRVVRADDDRYDATRTAMVTRRLRRGDRVAVRAPGVVRSAPSALTRDPTSAAAARAGRAAD